LANSGVDSHTLVLLEFSPFLWVQFPVNPFSFEESKENERKKKKKKENKTRSKANLAEDCAPPREDFYIQLRLSYNQGHIKASLI
jgi:hypothetical protein